MGEREILLGAISNEFGGGIDKLSLPLEIPSVLCLSASPPNAEEVCLPLRDKLRR